MPREAWPSAGTIPSRTSDGKPVKGKAEFETDWSGARWRFASAEHRDAFKAEEIGRASCRERV